MKRFLGENPFFLVVSGGRMTEFPLEESDKAMEFFKSQLLKFGHAAIYKRYHLIIKEEEN